jgi:hypothetical protein
VNTENFEVPYFYETTKLNFVCPLCWNMFGTKNVRNKCDHYLCSSYLSSVIQKTHKNYIECPVCKIEVRFNGVTPADDRFQIQV